jgi:uncharacterized protein (DUF427 family)
MIELCLAAYPCSVSSVVFPGPWRGFGRAGTSILSGKVMARATWNGIVIAESDTTETVEGNVYFPEDSLKREYFRPSSTTSTCPWKGQARYLNVLIEGQDNPDAAWYYPDPKPAARKIKGYVAFWRGVEVTP